MPIRASGLLHKRPFAIQQYYRNTSLKMERSNQNPWYHLQSWAFSTGVSQNAFPDLLLIGRWHKWTNRRIHLWSQSTFSETERSKSVAQLCDCANKKNKQLHSWSSSSVSKRTLTLNQKVRGCTDIILHTNHILGGDSNILDICALRWQKWIKNITAV